MVLNFLLICIIRHNKSQIKCFLSDLGSHLDIGDQKLHGPCLVGRVNQWGETTSSLPVRNEKSFVNHNVHVYIECYYHILIYKQKHLLPSLQWMSKVNGMYSQGSQESRSEHNAQVTGRHLICTAIGSNSVQGKKQNKSRILSVIW